MMIKDRNNLTNLEIIRKGKGLTREQLAILCGVSYAQICALEDKRLSFKEMKLSTLLKLSKGLRVKPTDILPIEIAKKLK